MSRGLLLSKTPCESIHGYFYGREHTVKVSMDTFTFVVSEFFWWKPNIPINGSQPSGNCIGTLNKQPPVPAVCLFIYGAWRTIPFIYCRKYKAHFSGDPGPVRRKIKKQKRHHWSGLTHLHSVIGLVQKNEPLALVKVSMVILLLVLPS